MIFSLDKFATTMYNYSNLARNIEYCFVVISDLKQIIFVNTICDKTI